MYSLEILKKIETIRTNLFPHPDLYREHLKNILIKPHWTGVLSDFLTWGGNEVNLGNKKPPCSRGTGLTSVHLLHRSLFSSSPPFPFSFPFPPSHFSLISSSERPLTVVSLCFCVFWGWSFHLHDTRSCTSGHLIQNDNCRCCGNKMTLGMYGWMPRLFRPLLNRNWESTSLSADQPCVHCMNFDVPYLVLFETESPGLWEVLCETDVWLPGPGKTQGRPSHTLMSWCFHIRGATQTFWEGHPSRIVAVIVAAHGGREEPVSFL